MADEIRFRYFKSVQGKVVPRYGTDVFIGVKRVRDPGWEWDTEKVVSIPEAETRRYLREYRRALKDGSIIEVSKPAAKATKPAVTEYDTNDPGEPEQKVTKRGSKGSRRKKETD